MPDAASASGAAMRARLVAAGRAAGGGRASAFASRAVSFARLCEPPTWLSASDDERGDIAALAALLTVVPTLSGVISGNVFGPLAEAFGDETLDAALEAEIDLRPSNLPPEPIALRQAGADLLAAALRGDADAAELMEIATALPGRVARESKEPAS